MEQKSSDDLIIEQLNALINGGSVQVTQSIATESSSKQNKQIKKSTNTKKSNTQAKPKAQKTEKTQKVQPKPEKAKKNNQEQVVVKKAEKSQNEIFLAHGGMIAYTISVKNRIFQLYRLC